MHGLIRDMHEQRPLCLSKSELFSNSQFFKNILENMHVVLVVALLGIKIDIYQVHNEL